MRIDAVRMDPRAMRRELIEGAGSARLSLRAALDALPASARDTWIDAVFDLDPLVADGPDLPRGCVPYLPCRVDLLLRVIDVVGLGAADVFVDLGAGIGRASALVHCLSGAQAIGIEVQSELAARARALAGALGRAAITTVDGDAIESLGAASAGTVFFAYCPFSGERFDRLVDRIGALPRSWSVWLCLVDLPLVTRDWLELVSTGEGSVGEGELRIYRSLPR